MSRQTEENDSSGVNYVQSKKDFLKLAGSLGQHPKYTDIYLFFRKNSIEKLIEQKLNSARPARYEKYEVMNVNGTNRLVERKKWPFSGVHAICLSWEEMFDMFMPLHVESGHRDQQYLSKKIKQMMVGHNIEYKYPWIALSLFHKACNICALNNKMLRPVKVCSVHAIAMAQRKLGDKFKYLLIYTDLDTYFTVLRPLMEKSHQEISTELYKIVMQFGPPNTILMHGYNPQLSENVEKLLSQLCCTFNIQVKHRPVKYELPTIVTDRIDAWMEKTKKSQWELGCFIVQAQLNHSQMVKPELKQFDVTPYDLQFHTKTFNKALLENDDDDNYSRNRPKNSKTSKTKTTAPNKAGKDPPKSSDPAKSVKQGDQPKSGVNETSSTTSQTSSTTSQPSSTTSQSTSSAVPANYTFLDAYLHQLAHKEEDEPEKKKKVVQWEITKKKTRTVVYR